MEELKISAFSNSEIPGQVIWKGKRPLQDLNLYPVRISDYKMHSHSFPTSSSSLNLFVPIQPPLQKAKGK